MLIDSHCHLHDREFFSKEQAETMLKNARQNGVQQIICIGTDREDSLVARDFANKHSNVFWSFGIHPSGAADIKNLNEIKFEIDEEYKRSAAGVRSTPRETLEASSNLISSNTLPVAIGETGLDYHYTPESGPRQIESLRIHIEAARRTRLPLIIHARDADGGQEPADGGGRQAHEQGGQHRDGDGRALARCPHAVH